jgi:hypothetical protein
VSRSSRPIFFLIVFAASALLASAAMAQTKYWIQFRDKGILPSRFVPGDSLFESTRASLSLAALFRRERTLNKPQNSVIFLEDAPLYQPYLQKLKKRGITVCNASKWGNAISARLTEDQAQQLLELPFVKAIFPVRMARIASIHSTEPRALATSALSESAKKLSAEMILSQDSTCSYDPIIYHYGGSDTDLKRIDVRPLHAMGLDAEGIRLGHLDVGCDTTVSSLDQATILFTYDYVFNDSNVANPQDQHGTNTLSVAIGNLPDTMMGPAYHASVMIAHTENTDYEQNIEEDNYAAAMEAFEARGVQITTSSLGYFTFDDGQHSYSYSDMNGHTAISTLAAQRAQEMGVLVVTAMGNGGGSAYPYVNAPADADSILACGALDVNDTIAGFSSRGPTYNRHIKPDISAPGVAVFGQNPDGTFATLDGTSFATPLTAGACCLIKQAHPEATAQEIREAVLKTGDRAAHPDTAYGWGKLNAYAAAVELGMFIHLMNISFDTELHVCVGISSKNRIKNVYLTFFGDTDMTPRTAQFQLVEDSLIYSCTTTLSQNVFAGLGPHIYYQVTAIDGSDSTVSNPPVGYNSIPNRLYSSVPESSSVPFQLDAYPNPASSSFTLNMSVPGEWRMVNQTGMIILKGVAQGPIADRIQTASLPSGTYEIEFISASGETETLPIVVIH